MSEFSDMSSSPFQPAPMMPFSWVPTMGSFKLLSPPSSASPSPEAGSSRRRKSSKPSYRHVPHREKPAHLVARRNARERRRVQAVNSAFARLRRCVPLENRGKRLSKVKTLHRAIEYINDLQALLQQASDDERQEVTFQEEHEILNKENEGQLWTAAPTEYPCQTSCPEGEQSYIYGKEYESDMLHGLKRPTKLYALEDSELRKLNSKVVCESSYWNYVPYSEDYAGSLTS